jgi:flagellar protein FlbD
MEVDGSMIAVTRLNGKKFVINAEQIRYIETTPDTMITMLAGDKVVVKETLEEVVRLAIQYQRQIHAFGE